jgi:cell division septal protein FtsQ
MRRVRHGRLRRRAAGTLLVAALAVAAGFAPRALRDVDAFRVRRVEVHGARYLDPYAVVRAAGLDRRASLFDDKQGWRSGVLTLPLVEDVRVRRTLPSTVTLEVREVAPLALVAGDALRPVDRDGRILEIEPAGAVLDLPIVLGGSLAGARVGEDARAALDVLAALHARAPELADRVSQLEVGPAGLRVVLRDHPAEALLPLRPTGTQLTQLRLAFADLAARGEMDRVVRVDVRFRDQVVVSFLATPMS